MTSRERFEAAYAAGVSGAEAQSRARSSQRQQAEAASRERDRILQAKKQLQADLSSHVLDSADTVADILREQQAEPPTTISYGYGSGRQGADKFWILDAGIKKDKGALCISGLALATNGGIYEFEGEDKYNSYELSRSPIRAEYPGFFKRHGDFISITGVAAPESIVPISMIASENGDKEAAHTWDNRFGAVLAEAGHASAQ